MALVIIDTISDLHRWETHVATCPSSITQVQGAPFFLCNTVKYSDVTLEFGKHITFVAIVIIAMISDLHLGGKLMSRYIKYPKRLFSSVTVSIGM